MKMTTINATDADIEAYIVRLFADDNINNDIIKYS